MTRRVIRSFGAVVVVASGVLVGSGHLSAQLPLQPAREAGESVTPAFEGWYQNADGSYNLLVGYFNRNTKQIVDIPVGPNNRIEPGGPDMGQPTHFLPRRQWGVFQIRVPKDFGDKRLTWTIVANGKPMSIPIGVIKDYQIEPFKDQAMGNEPPEIGFDEKSAKHQGPPKGFSATYTATVGTPLTLSAWIADKAGVTPERTAPAAAPPPAAGRGGEPAGRGGDAPRGFAPVRMVWSKYRGPGDVTFASATPTIDLKANGKAQTTATFSAPGEYWLRAQVNDASGDGGGGFQCCWTNAHVKVTVTGSTTK
jgi:hypothetical protein